MKQCISCNKDFPREDNFCDKCGGKLEKKTLERNHKFGGKNLKFIVSITTLSILSIIFIFTIPLPFTVSEIYLEEASSNNGKECYNAPILLIPGKEITLNSLDQDVIDTSRCEEENAITSQILDNGKEVGEKKEIKCFSAPGTWKENVRVICYDGYVPRDINDYITAECILPTRKICNMAVDSKEIEKIREITKYATLFQRWTGRVN